MNSERKVLHGEYELRITHEECFNNVDLLQYRDPKRTVVDCISRMSCSSFACTHTGRDTVFHADEALSTEQAIDCETRSNATHRVERGLGLLLELLGRERRRRVPARPSGPRPRRRAGRVRRAGAGARAGAAAHEHTFSARQHKRRHRETDRDDTYYEELCTTVQSTM